MSEWQLIETAPKDGTHILARRVPIGIRFTNLTNPPTVVHWFNDPEEPGFYTSVNERAPEHPFEATHWMHLPDASPATPPAEAREVVETLRAALREAIDTLKGLAKDNPWAEWVAVPMIVGDETVVSRLEAALTAREPGVTGNAEGEK